MASPLEHRSMLLWALWNNVDPADLLNDPDYMRIMLRGGRSAATGSAQTQRTQATDKNSCSDNNGWVFPCRPAQYAKLYKVRKRQNQVRVQYTSRISSDGVDERHKSSLQINAQPSTFNEHVADHSCSNKKKDIAYPTNETFLTELTDTADNTDYTAGSRPLTNPDITSNKVCLPAFLPTIQARATSQKKCTSKCQTSVVERYLQENELISTDMQYYQPPTTPATTIDAIQAYKRKNGTKSAPEYVTKYQEQSTSGKPREPKKARRKAKLKSTRSKAKKSSKLHTSKNRQLSSNSTASTIGSSSSLKTNPQSYIYSDLVSHFSRISMRQVQATLNSSKLALPSIV